MTDFAIIKAVPEKKLNTPDILKPTHITTNNLYIAKHILFSFEPNPQNNRRNK